MIDHLQKIIIVSLISLVFLSGASAADWEFDTLEEPYNHHNLSANTSNIFLTRLKTNEGESLAPGDIQDLGTETGQDPSTAPYVLYEYEKLNETTGNPMTVNRSLSYDQKLGLWYAKISPDYSGMDYIEFKAQGEHSDSGGVDSNGEANQTIEVNVSEINNTLLEENLDVDISSPIKAGIQEKFDVRTINTTDETPIGEASASVNLYFHNASQIDKMYELDNYNSDSLESGGQYHYNSEINIPSETDQAYVLRINSTATDGTSSSMSMLVNTAKAINGEISEITGKGCNDDFSQCEPEAELNPVFDITNANAQHVNMTLYGVNKSTGNRVNLTSPKMMNEISASEGAEQTFESSLQIPDLNTSEYERGLELEFYAWNDLRTYTEVKNIELKSFKVEDRSNPTAFKGKSHEIRVLLGKMFSLEPYNKSRFNQVNVTLESPDADFNQSFTASQLEFQEADGVMTADVVIPEDESKGTYTLTVNAEDVYGIEKEFSSGLNVRDLNATFSAPEELNLAYSSLGEFSETIDVENLVDTENTIKAETDSEFLVLPEELALSPGAVEEMPLGVNLTSTGDYEAEIDLTDNETGYNETVEVSIDGPNCAVRDNNICIDKDELQFTAEDKDAVNQTLTVVNLARNPLQLETTLNGNISDSITTKSNFNVSDSEILELSFQSSTPGNYTGNWVFTGNDSEASVNLSAEADFEVSDPEMSVSPTTIELGSLPEGETVVQEVTVENTGNLEIQNISVLSDYSFGVEAFTLSPGDSRALELEFEDVDSSTISIVGQASGEDVGTDIRVNGEVIQDYSERTDEISDRVNDLQSQTDDTELNNRLMEVSSMKSQVESQWSSGNYEEARTTFQDAQTRLDEIEVDIATQGSDGSDNGGADQKENGGGLPIIPIIMILLVLSVVGGFVFYESYIPEEGDPLYGVMG